jgi:hypothetical protein
MTSNQGEMNYVVAEEAASWLLLIYQDEVLSLVCDLCEASTC